MARYSLAFAAWATAGAAAAAGEAAAYSQCGGQGWTGATACVAGYQCQAQNEWYSQCVLGSDAATAAAADPKTTMVTLTGSSAPAKMTSTVSAAASSGKTKYGGMNIAGLEFGCDINGTCTTGGYADPGANGTAQMKHFSTNDGMNIYRLPIGWQHLLKHTLGGNIDATIGAAYDKLVQGCLATGALCLIDLHNYARWDGKIVGQGGPTNAQFADVWSKLATKYKSEANVIFGLMNEPHDLDMTIWAESCQAAVTAIRKAGATSQMILLPGTDFTSAGAFATKSGPALLKVKDSDGTTSKLIFDVHRYLDADSSGTTTECVSDHVEESFIPLAKWLRTNKRQAILSEIGGGNVVSCEKYVCAALASLNTNSDVYLGYIGWSAGAFGASYELNMSPNGSKDQPLVSKCFSRA